MTSARVRPTSRVLVLDRQQRVLLLGSRGLTTAPAGEVQWWYTPGGGVEDGEDLKGRGNFTDHEYEIKCDGDVVATISKKWFRVRDTYGIEVREGEDEPLMLSLAVAIDAMSHHIDA